MQVYAEYAFIENFFMDFTLLYAAKAASKNPAKYGRLAFAAVFGACFAVAYPLFGLKGVAAVAVKLASGVALCAVAGRYHTFKGFLKFTLVFLAATALLGGALMAIFALAGEGRGAMGEGFILSSVPVGIPMFFALVLAFAVRKLRARFSTAKGGTATCTIYLKQNKATCKGFFDSGNKVYSGGAPVSIVPESVAEKLTDIGRIKTFVDIHTVAGKSKIAVFTADKLEIDDGKSKTVRQNVTLGVSPQRIKGAVLHPDLSEVN